MSETFELNPEVNTKQVMLKGGDTFNVPRDPGRYRPTNHFGQRLHERVPAEMRDMLIQRLIAGGHCRAVSLPKGVDDGSESYKQAFAFERRVRNTDWRLVVGITPKGCRTDQPHWAITIMRVHDD